MVAGTSSRHGREAQWWRERQGQRILGQGRQEDVGQEDDGKGIWAKECRAVTACGWQGWSADGEAKVCVGLSGLF
jgi:hypothetical protein